MQPVVIGFYGRSNAGKTSLMTHITQQLTTEGYHVAVIKKSDKKGSFDQEGKDTWRHRQAGASIVVLSTPVETNFLIRGKQQTGTIIDSIMMMDAIDVILIEGANDPSIMKIRVGVSNERENTIGYYHDNNVDQIYKIIKKRITHGSNLDYEHEVKLKVNGESVPLSQFPSDFMKSSIIGMLQSLKGVSQIDSVEIRF